ncbi:hypothetical protein SK128_014655 [Halocaridina rubra]|uniref:AMP-binding enzyme C-terminal domain-containing protein n=1 Tax=Halocaridina rubra TaxID=373956 RepID=A0AAN8WL18_HALRR
MLGYANNPKATAETLDDDGWLHTGDLAYYDKDDIIYLTDRIKDLIKVKGHQVAPTELENLIQTLENVREVAVAGVPNERLGEAPRAWIVPVPGTTIDKMAVMKHVADNVAQYKQLAGGIEVVKSIPRNHIGKILRKELKKAFVSTVSKL